jgi:hypothetical protein
MTEESTPAEEPAKPKLPAVRHLLLDAPLYAPFAFVDSDETRDALETLRGGDIQFDAHCIYCKRSSVFKTARTTRGSGSGQAVNKTWMLMPGNWAIDVHCVRAASHTYRYYLSIQKFELRKIGQWPSLEDIAGADIEKYRSQLKDGYFRELKVATGLASHGVGIGSFVYLRRIFERLIYQHHDELPEPIEGFGTMRMDEKIDALKAVLPPLLVKNRATYAILSKGLHQLDEKQCQLYFPVVRAAIITILEQDFQKREAEKAEAALADQINEISRALKG